uniref:Adenylosuccinate lyase n=1 Tax=Ignisphaera aggregans TaxID=334771 RepID=A0A7J2U120_9CREN
MEHICVFEWRYGSEEMRRLFLAESIVKRYIDVEVAVMRGLEEAGIAPRGCAEAMRRCVEGVRPEEVYEREAVTGHDIASLAYIIGERCGECGRFAHLGATSYDIVDTAWALIIRDALRIVKERLWRVVEMLIEYAERYRDVVMVGRTHGQHAVPITLGFKFANYIYEFSRSLERLCEAEKRIVRSKVSGAVGTMAAWGGRGLVVESVASKMLGLEPHTISTQVAPRDSFAELVTDLAILASQLDRFALEVRELSRTEIGEIYEAGKRIGSSTMPQKRNPVTAERISGLAKVVRAFTITALENIPLMHERDLTNSSSERILIPHTLLAIDQMLLDMEKLLKTLYIDEEAIERNLKLSKGTIMAEAVMIKLVEKGMPRHEAHKLLSELALTVGNEDFYAVLIRNEIVRKYLTPEEIAKILDPRSYLGNYKELIDRVVSYAKNVRALCSS